MAIERKANARWNGNLKQGNGTLSVPSTVLTDTPYSFRMRFEDQPGTNPEELIAAAHAGCFTMNFSGVLERNGTTPEQLETEATCVMTPKEGGGMRISAMRLQVRGRVSGLDQQKFQELAEEAERTCPVSGALHGNMDISVEATLEQ